MRLPNTVRKQLIRYTGGADEIAEHSQEEPDNINEWTVHCASGANEIAEYSLERADKINVCRWC